MRSRFDHRERGYHHVGDSKVVQKPQPCFSASRAKPTTPAGIAAWIFAAAMAVVPSGCKRAAAPVAPLPEVVVTDVVQRNVPVYSESVGTTEGFVNADVYSKITGYLLKQNYRDGDQVHSGQLLFQIDDREYKAALDQALGDLGQKQVHYKKNKQDLDKITPLYQEQVASRQDFDHITQTTRASAAAVASA
jgi:membrane fusion protein (multidrug efflux system)